MNRKQWLFWIVFVVLITSAILVNNYSINHKVLRVGDVEGFMNRLMKTNLINSELSYGTHCYEVTVDRNKEISNFRVLTVDKKTLKTIHFTRDEGYYIRFRGYVTERNYIEYTDVTLNQLENFSKDLIQSFDLYNQIEDKEEFIIELTERFDEDVLFEYDETYELEAYIQGKGSSKFNIIREDTWLDESAYRFIIYKKNDEESSYHRQKLFMVYKYF